MTDRNRDYWPWLFRSQVIRHRNRS